MGKKKREPFVGAASGSAAPASFRRQAIAVFAVAFALRLLYLLSVRHQPFFEHLLTEPARYRGWALAILHGSSPAHLPFDEAPAYPYLLASLFAVFGPAAFPAAVFQAVLDSLSAVALGWVGHRLAGERAGWIAGMLAAGCGPLIYFTGEVLPATPLIAALAMSLAATPSGTAGTPHGWWLAGGAWGAALFVRAEIALALPVLLFHAYLLGGRRALGRAGAAPAALLCLSLGLNVASSGHWVPLTAGSGVNLWLGNNPQADGLSPFIHGEMAPVATQVTAQAHDAVEADALFRREALHFALEQPGREAHLLVRKFLWTWTDRELPNTSDPEWETSQSWLYATPLFPLRFGLLLPLGLAGAALLGGGWRRHAILAAPAAVALGTSLVFFTNGRFRLALWATLLPLAGLAASRLWEARSRWREERRAWVLPGIAAGLGALVAFANFEGVRGYRLAEIDVNTGSLLRKTGRFEDAARYLRLGVEEGPTDPGAWIELALALEQAGRFPEAEATWREATTQLPEDLTVRRMAANFLRRQARP